MPGSRPRRPTTLPFAGKTRNVGGCAPGPPSPPGSLAVARSASARSRNLSQRHDFCGPSRSGVRRSAGRRSRRSRRGARTSGSTSALRPACRRRRGGPAPRPGRRPRPSGRAGASALASSAPVRGEPVVEARGPAGVGRGDHQSGRLEVAKALRQHVRRQPGQLRRATR